MVASVFLDRAMASATARGSAPTSVRSAASMATSVPVPMAMPRSAWASAAASLTPSPTMATTCAVFLQAPDRGQLAARAHARDDVVDADRGGHRASGALVVAGKQHRPQAAGAQLGHGRRGGRRPCRRRRRTPRTARPRRRRRRSARRPRPAPPARPARGPAAQLPLPGEPGRACRPGPRGRPPRRKRRGPDRRRIPRVVEAGTTSAGAPTAAARRRRAPAAIAAAIGCSDADSTAPASRSSSVSCTPGAAATPASVIRPAVIVPVLSSTTVSTRRVLSRISGPLIRMPSCAPRPVPTRIAVGVARPIAHGQAMIRTATAAVNAAAGPAPDASQPARVAAAITSTTGTKIALTRSARRCTGALPAWAWVTSRARWASSVSAPTWVARTSRRPPTFT